MSAIAQEIANQIGHKAFVMMGTKNDRWCDGNALIFTVRGSRKWKKVRVTLAVDDTYTVEFFKISGAPDHKVTSQRFDGIYCDGLKSLIEEETGVLLSL